MAEKKTNSYIETVGRRKTSTARVRMTPSTKMSILINEKEYDAYFPTNELKGIINDPFSESKISDKFEITVHVNGGGSHSQAEAVRHGIARGLVEFNAELHDVVKKAGYLKRDPRAKERRKFGLKKARKAPQWSKR